MYDFERLGLSEVEGARYCSELNPWLDFVVVIIDKEKTANYALAIEKAMDEFWDGTVGCYGDLVEDTLKKAELPYIIVYFDINHEDDEKYIDAWEKFLGKFKRIYEVNT